jgi:hypothetical protein
MARRRRYIKNSYLMAFRQYGITNTCPKAY